MQTQEKTKTDNMIHINDAAKVGAVSVKTLRTYIDKQFLKNVVKDETGWRLDFDELAVVLQQRADLVKKAQAARQKGLERMKRMTGADGQKDKRFIRLSEAAKKYGFHIGTLWNIVKLHIPTRKQGNERYVDDVKLAAYVAARQKFETPEYVLAHEAADVIAERTGMTAERARYMFKRRKMRPDGKAGARAYYARKRVQEFADGLKREVKVKSAEKSAKPAQANAQAKSNAALKNVLDVLGDIAAKTPVKQADTVYAFDFDGLPEISNIVGAIFRSKMTNNKYCFTAEDTDLLRALAKTEHGAVLGLFADMVDSGRSITVYVQD